MNSSFGYLERGTLIQVGTILRKGNILSEVVAFRPLPPRESYGKVIYNFIVEVAQFGVDADLVEYDKQDLEEMKDLKIYNES